MLRPGLPRGRPRGPWAPPLLPLLPLLLPPLLPLLLPAVHCQATAASDDVLPLVEDDTRGLGLQALPGNKLVGVAPQPAQPSTQRGGAGGADNPAALATAPAAYTTWGSVPSEQTPPSSPWPASPAVGSSSPLWSEADNTDGTTQDGYYISSPASPASQGLSDGPEPSAEPDAEGLGALEPEAEAVSPASKVPRSVAYTLSPASLGGPTLPAEGRPAYSAAYAAGNEVLCAPGAYCTPLVQCRTILDLLDRTCLSGDKLSQLSCGSRGTETMVCCPPGGFSPIYMSTVVPARPSAAAVTVAPPPGTTPDPLPAKCGEPHLHNWRSRYSGVGAQPWVARIGFKKVDTGVIEYPCCGSILSERVVLTAAHCALAKTSQYKLSSVRVGEFDADEDPDCSAGFCARPPQDIAVDHVVVHPSYERASFRHDVALLVLKAPMAFSVSVQPVCISQNVAGVVGQRAKLVGWGITAGQSDVPGRQQQLDLPVVPLESCAQVYERVVPVTSDQLCVGGERGRDACSGFGGAPLVALDATGSRYYQVALVSFGSSKCGVEGVPSVYTRVDHYTEWIRANMVQ